MYLLFRDHHILPSVIYSMKPGEKEVVRAFMHREIEDRMKEMESLKED